MAWQHSGIVLAFYRNEAWHALAILYSNPFFMN
jgi:hypothetical protein